MDYTIVTLPEKLIVGLTTRTNNSAPDLPDKITTVWQDFYQSYYASIPFQVSGKGLGVYTEYAGDHLSDYTLMAAVEVSQLPPDLAPPLTSLVIPGGTYARFSLHGKVPDVVASFWQELWATPLPRKYTCDFEEYGLTDAMDESDLCVYIALQE